MTIYEATERLREIANEASKRLEALPLYIHTEEFFSDARLGPTVQEKAKYISVTLVISTAAPDDEDGGIEHRIGIGVEVKSKKVSEDDIEAARLDFEKIIDDACERLTSAEVCADELAALENEADEKYREMIEAYKKSLPKKLLLLIGAVIIAVGLIVLATVL